MINKLDLWIDQTLAQYAKERQCCAILQSEFEGFFPLAFLQNCFFVVVDEIPQPEIEDIHQVGLENFIANFFAMPLPAMSYKNTYFILRNQAENLSVHFQELVHLLQWEYLGSTEFMTRFIQEIQLHGFQNAALQKTATTLSARFANHEPAFDVPTIVRQSIGYQK